MNLTFTNPILPIGEIKIKAEFSRTASHLDKLKKCMDFYRDNGRFDRQIIVDSENYLHDGYCAYLTAYLLGVKTVKVLMVGEQAEPVKAVPPAKPEPVKLYCVKSFIDILSAGKIYEPDESGYITYDDGRKSNYSVSDWKFDFIRIGNLVPLVRRPAKVGEWVYVTHTDYKDDLEPGDIAQVIGAGSGGSICIAKDRTAYLGGLCYRQDEYLVLSGYTGDPA